MWIFFIKTHILKIKNKTQLIYKLNGEYLGSDWDNSNNFFKKYFLFEKI